MLLIIILVLLLIVLVLLLIVLSPPSDTGLCVCVCDVFHDTRSCFVAPLVLVFTHVPKIRVEYFGTAHAGTKTE